MLTHRSREGYLLIDHRSSPGLPEDVALSLGLDPTMVGEGKLLEAASLTCSHCKVVVIKNPGRTRERAHCFKCNHYVCDGCEAESRKSGYVHAPFEKMVDDGLTRAARAQSGSFSSPLCAAS